MKDLLLRSRVVKTPSITSLCRRLAEYVKKCSTECAAHAARLFFRIQKIILICSVVIAVAVVIS